MSAAGGLVMRVVSFALSISVLAGCCFTPDPAAPVVTPPPVTTPPVVPPIAPPTVAAPTGSMETCIALCEHAGHCLDTRGVPRTPETADCANACTTGHTYGSLPPQAYACLNQPTCGIFESCVNAAMGAALAGAAGAPMIPPTGVPTGLPGAAPPTPTAAGTPVNWPEGFPVVPGGMPVEAPAAGPVRVAVLMYAGMSGADLDARYHEALAGAGWTATPSEPGPEARRFSATRGAATVSVSVLEADGASMIQTMQF